MIYFYNTKRFCTTESFICEIIFTIHHQQEIRSLKLVYMFYRVTCLTIAMSLIAFVEIWFFFTVGISGFEQINIFITIRTNDVLTIIAKNSTGYMKSAFILLKKRFKGHTS